MYTLIYQPLNRDEYSSSIYALIVTETAHPCGPADTEEYIHHQLEWPNCSHLLQCSFLNHFLKTSDIMFCVSLTICIGHKQCDSYRTARHVLFFKQFNKQEVSIEELRVYTYCQLLSLCLLHQWKWLLTKNKQNKEFCFSEQHTAGAFLNKSVN